MTGRYSAVLAVESDRQTRHISPPASGVVIGSSKTCGVFINDINVLPEHARLFKDPFGRWIIEAVHKEVMLNVNGTPGVAFSIQSGDRVRLGKSTIRLIDNSDSSIIPNAVVTSPVKFNEHSGRQTLTNEAECYVEFSKTQLEELDRITDCLAGLTEAQALYAAVCELLSEPEDTVTLVVKVPKVQSETVNNSRVLCQRGKLSHPYISPSSPTPSGMQNIHLSRTVLEAVRKIRKAFMATSLDDDEGDDDVRLTIIDDTSPRMVLAAPIAETSTGLDVLYIDQPAMAFRTDALGFFAVVARMISLSRKSLIMAEYKAERKALNNQLNTALEIQSNLMPKNLHLYDEIELALFYKPAGWVGGDYCDLCKASDGRLMFSVGDVSGKGMPAAMVMANVHSMIRSMLLFSTNSTEIINRVNTMLCDTLLDGMFVTLLLGFIDPASGETEYVNAGHELPLKISQNGGVKVLGYPVNMPLGIINRPFEPQTVSLQKGDGLFIYSDGITDTFAPNDDKFGHDRLINAVNSASGQNCQHIVDNVVSAINKFRLNHPAGDDATMLTLKWMNG